MSSIRHAAPSRGEQVQKQGPRVGVVMLDTRFPRIAGDVGCPASYGTEPLFRIATGVTVSDVVRPEGVSAHHLEALIIAARTLEQDGADIITTSCGLLHGVQAQLASSVDIPVIASSLSLLDGLTAEGWVPAILTAHSPTLTALLPDLTHMVGMETSDAFQRAILSNGPALDRNAIKADVVLAAQAAKTGGATCTLLECTNLPPYREAIERETGLRVFDILDALEMAVGSTVRA